MDITPQIIGYLPDLADHLLGLPGTERITDAPVSLGLYCLTHLADRHPDRLEWVSMRLQDLREAVKNPDYVMIPLELKKTGHWSLTIGRELDDGHYMIVAISLANAPGEPESKYHQLTTIHPAKRSFLFFRDAGGWKLKSAKWIDLKRKAGP